jgi:hypothetical protein
LILTTILFLFILLYFYIRITGRSLARKNRSVHESRRQNFDILQSELETFTEMLSGKNESYHKVVWGGCIWNVIVDIGVILELVSSFSVIRSIVVQLIESTDLLVSKYLRGRPV